MAPALTSALWGRRREQEAVVGREWGLDTAPMERDGPGALRCVGESAVGLTGCL